MLTYDLRHDDGILVLMPGGPLEAADFDSLAAHVDAYLTGNRVLRGVMIKAQSFPGWKDFSALLAHLKFVKDHHRKIEKVAVVADGGFAHVMPRLASHFIKAEVRRFDPADEDAAWAWLHRATVAAV